MSEEKISFLKKYKYHLLSIGAPLLAYLFWETKNQFKNNKSILQNIIPLKKSESIARKQTIKNIKYDLFLYLENPQFPILEKYLGYKGHINIKFEINNKRPIHLDYLGDILSFKLNDKQYIPKVKNNRIILDEELLKQGENSLDIVFVSKYYNLNDKPIGLTYTYDQSNVI